MRDTRSLFAPMCAHKETSWDSLSPKTVDDERMKVLLKLPRKQVAWGSSPVDDIFSAFYKAGEKKAGPSFALEWVVERMGEEDDQLQYFYVNNEGWYYARYCFRFEPRAV
jgi:hypothetical protein